MAMLPQKTGLLPSTTVSKAEKPGHLEEVVEVKEDEQRINLIDPDLSNVKILADPSIESSDFKADPKVIRPDILHTSKVREFSTSIVPCCMERTENNDVWITPGGGEPLTMYDETGHEKKTLKLTFGIADVALFSSQEIVVTDRTNNRIVRVSSIGDVTTLCSTAPLKPWGVCINDRQQLVVGLRRRRGLERKLVVYCGYGSHVVQEMEKDENGNALFGGHIYQVRQNGNGDYVVIDDYMLLCLTNDGKLRWRVTESFIWGVECDTDCNVIYCDNGGVTILDIDGTLIRQLLSSETDGIVRPLSISLDRQKRLWIGLSGKFIQIWCYLQ